MFPNPFTNSNEKAYFDSIKKRESISDDAFYRDYYANTDVTLNTCARVRRVLCEQLRMCNTLPNDNVAIVSDVDIGEVCFELAEEFAVTFSSADINEIDSTVDSLVQLTQRQLQRIGGQHGFSPKETVGVVAPYESPATGTSSVSTPITDAIVRRLIDGTDTETLTFYDVSDCQIYGRKHLRQLSGTLAADAASVGCVPTVYQSVLWFCLVFVPVWPIGTYYIMPCVKCDDPDGDADQYRAVRANWDTAQVLVHYLPFAVHFIVVAAGLVAWCWRT